MRQCEKCHVHIGQSSEILGRPLKHQVRKADKVLMYLADRLSGVFVGGDQRDLDVRVAEQ